MSKFPDGAILVPIDDVGLYPHIPHYEGLTAVRKALNNRCDSEIPTNDIVDLVEFLKITILNLMVNITCKKEVLVLGLEWRPLMPICLCMIMKVSY